MACSDLSNGGNDQMGKKGDESLLNRKNGALSLPKPNSHKSCAGACGKSNQNNFIETIC